MSRSRLTVAERIALPRPRDGGPEFLGIRRRLLGLLGLELPPPGPVAELLAFPSGEACA